MHSVTSFLEFKILKLIHFQGGQGRAKGSKCSPCLQKETLTVVGLLPHETLSQSLITILVYIIIIL